MTCTHLHPGINLSINLSYVLTLRWIPKIWQMLDFLVIEKKEFCGLSGQKNWIHDSMYIYLYIDI